MRNILVVIDDNELDLAIMNEIFKNKFEVQCFSSTLKGMAYIQKKYKEIALILLDICLGSTGTGFNVLNHLKKKDELKKIPFILMTSDANEEAVREGIENGAVDFLVKPVNPHSVTNRVEQFIERAWADEKEEQKQTENEKKEVEAKDIISEKDINNIVNMLIKHVEVMTEERNILSLEKCKIIGKITSILAKTYFEEQNDLSDKITELDAKIIGKAAMFYDIGRIGIYDKDLQSDDDLVFTKKYQRHTEIGYQFFAFETNQNLFYKHAADISRWHHRNADGTGYPEIKIPIKVPISAQLTRAALRCYMYAEKFQNQSDCMRRVLMALTSEINNVITFQMYDVVRMSAEKIERVLREHFID